MLSTDPKPVYAGVLLLPQPSGFFAVQRQSDKLYLSVQGQGGGFNKPPTWVDYVADQETFQRSGTTPNVFLTVNCGAHGGDPTDYFFVL